MRRQYDVFQSDVFSLGMTMLQVASLRPSSTLYDWKNHEVKWDKVEDALTGLLANYSGDFVGYLRTMLSKEPTNRPTFQDIHSWTEQPFQQEATYIPPPVEQPAFQQEQELFQSHTLPQQVPVQSHVMQNVVTHEPNQYKHQNYA